MRRTCLLAAGLVGIALAGRASFAAPSAAEIRFNRDIRPILSDNCFACHGPDSARRKAGLRLDGEAGLFGPRENGPAVVKGKPKDSAVYARITSDDPDEQMPPAASHKKLTGEQKELLRRWIEAGAPWEAHWSLVPPVRPNAPPVKRADWARTPIDRFILARLEAEGLDPAPVADRRTLARRVTLDLTGLPPKPDEVEAFVNDPSSDAYERLVDRLLDSPRYGEHRARYWLDAARYGDTHGIHIDNYREAWPYRDWVIAAFNRNLPFDRFTVEQIAGDLLPGRKLDQQIATGFHRCNITTNEGGVIPDEVEANYAKDRVDTTATVWLGLTAGCAACHDHKFDPISQKEFYQFTAFFRNTTQKPLDGNVQDTPPVIVVPQGEDRLRWGGVQKEVAALRADLARHKSEAEKAFEYWRDGPLPKAVRDPLDATHEHLAARLDEGEGGFTLVRNGQAEVVTLPTDVSWGTGPAKDAALTFAARGAVEVAGAGDFDADQPFSLGGWVYAPPGDGVFVLASKIAGQTRGAPGWVLELNARTPLLRLTGPGNGNSFEVRGTAAKRLTAGMWSHVFVTYDGSRYRDGVSLYINGTPVASDPVENSSVLKGSIRNAAPMRLGSDGQRDFRGGGLQDVRVYARTLLPEEAAVVAKWGALRAALARDDGKLTGAEQADLRLLFLNRFDEAYRTTALRLASTEAEQRFIRRRSPVTLVMEEKANSKPSARLLYRGQYDQPRDTVSAGTPAALQRFPAEWPQNRLGLAWWLVDKTNPLAARVTVNRFWQEVFGQGIVRTSEDFGVMGENPSHPELLDWLAAEFMEPTTGRTAAWDVKHVMRLLVTSAAYRQAAVNTTEKLKKDPANRLVSRGPRFRMDAEELRDCALAAGGLLSEKIGGPSVHPYQPPGVWEAVAMVGSNTRFYKQDAGEALYRRGLYTFWKRAAPPASMEILNAPSRESCTVRRERTNTPLQALVMMNDPQWVEAARALAQRAMLESPSGDNAFDRRLDFVTTRIVSRPFNDRERRICRASLDSFIATYQNMPDAAEKLIRTGQSKPDANLGAADLATWTMLVSQVMNTDEALNK